MKRVEVGTGSTIVGYTVPTAPLRLGRHSTIDGFPSTGSTMMGMIYGLGAPSLAHYQSWCDLVIADERIRPMPGFSAPANTPFRVDFQDASGGAMPAVLTDRDGSLHMTRVGAPPLVSHYSRNFAW
jgi:hypothetical protein